MNTKISSLKVQKGLLINRVKEENLERIDNYFRLDYNPKAGDKKSEVIDRFCVRMFGGWYYLPKSMENNPIVTHLKAKTIMQLKPYHTDEETFKKEIISGLSIERLKHDFEFWCIMCAKIQDKETKTMIPLILNRGQRKVVREMEKQRINGVPIRIILVKARQWGGSTIIQAYMCWLQIYHYKGWHSAIISQLQSQSVNIRSTLSKLLQNLPKYHKQLTFKSYERQQNIKWIPQRGAVVYVTSAQQTDALRSFDFAMMHMSEVALWPDTPQKSGDDIAQSAYATIPYAPGTLIALESTAKGVGTFFHKQWLDAISNQQNKLEGGLTPIFVAWFEIPLYRKKIINVDAFIESLDDYSKWQWKQGATLEGINWYQWYKRVNNYSDFQMKSEFPTTAEEAFQTKSGKYFPDDYIHSLRASCRQPKFIGELRSDATTGEESLNNLFLVNNGALQTEVLKIWVMPNDGIDPTTEKVLNRFIVSVDIGGRTYKSDNSVISVFDRMGMMIENGPIERAAIWYGHTDPDVLAWLAVKIAKFYNNALLVIENNSIDSRYKKESENYVNEGNHFYTVLDEIGEAYDNLYMRQGPPDSITGQPTFKIGWHMNKSTKYQAYDSYFKQVRDQIYIERDNGTVDEAQWLQLNSSGQIEAQKGQRDDKQDTTAVGVYLARERMSPVRIINKLDNNNKTHSGSNEGHISKI